MSSIIQFRVQRTRAPPSSNLYFFALFLRPTPRWVHLITPCLLYSLATLFFPSFSSLFHGWSVVSVTFSWQCVYNDTTYIVALSMICPEAAIKLTMDDNTVAHLPYRSIQGTYSVFLDRTATPQPLTDGTKFVIKTFAAISSACRKPRIIFKRQQLHVKIVSPLCLYLLQKAALAYLFVKQFICTFRKPLKRTFCKLFVCTFNTTLFIHIQLCFLYVSLIQFGKLFHTFSFYLLELPSMPRMFQRCPRPRYPSHHYSSPP